MGIFDWLFGKSKPSYDNSTAWVEYRDNPSRRRGGRGRSSAKTGRRPVYAPQGASLGAFLGAPVGGRGKGLKVRGRSVRPNPYAPCDSDEAWGRVPKHLRRPSKYASSRLNLTRGKHAGTMEVIGCGTSQSRVRKYGGRRDTTFAVRFLEPDMSVDGTRGIRYVPKSWFTGNARRIERIAKAASSSAPAPKRRKKARRAKATAQPTRRTTAKRATAKRAAPKRLTAGTRRFATAVRGRAAKALPRGTKRVRGNLCIGPDKKFASCASLKVRHGGAVVARRSKGSSKGVLGLSKIRKQYERAVMAGDPLAPVLQRRLIAMTGGRSAPAPARKPSKPARRKSRPGRPSARDTSTASLQSRYDAAVASGSPTQYLLRAELMKARPNPFYAVPRGHRF